MNGFWADGPSEYWRAIQPRIEELQQEMDSFSELRDLTEDPVEKDRLDLEIREKYSEYAALMAECDQSLF